jgi:hypothetical protein
MHTATVTFRSAEFAQKMSEMRIWLDQNLLEPVRFTYKQDRQIISISVEFQEDDQAEAFHSRFAGRQRERAASLRQREAASWLRSAQKQVNRAAGVGFAMPEPRGTMAQACWYRLVAEEIRTEADNFGSDSAKETMENAARGWEQLAEELEDRLARNGDPQRGFLFR